jgi:hypothetical protein
VLVVTRIALATEKVSYLEFVPFLKQSVHKGDKLVKVNFARAFLADVGRSIVPHFGRDLD